MPNRYFCVSWKSILNRFCFFLTCLTVLLLRISHGEQTRVSHYHKHILATKIRHSATKKTCLNLEDTLRARHKACFLRPDTGPCRSDIIQWYFDVKQNRCYRFFWGGCQGNGNRFETRQMCRKHCFLNATAPPMKIPYFCSLAFDYGNCFGYFNRWTWDRFYKTCKRRLYSGCGGNQNNFQTRNECFATCLKPPNNTILQTQIETTCIPFNVPEFM